MTTWKTTSFLTMRTSLMSLLSATMVPVALKTRMMKKGPRSAGIRAANGVTRQVQGKDVEEGLAGAHLVLRRCTEAAKVANRDASTTKAPVDAVVAAVEC
jgi:hypothetical protein